MITLTASLPMVRENIATATPIRTPANVWGAAEIHTLAQEAFLVFTLDAKNKMIGKHLVSLGILNASLVHPREVFAPAIVDRAAAVVLAHNHPSGDTTPSAEDLAITRQLIEAGKLLDMRVLDHVVIAGTDYLSMREEGLAKFE